jgi:hypothetical protein
VSFWVRSDIQTDWRSGKHDDLPENDPGPQPDWDKEADDGISLPAICTELWRRGAQTVYVERNKSYVSTS